MEKMYGTKRNSGELPPFYPPTNNPNKNNSNYGSCLAHGCFPEIQIISSVTNQLICKGKACLQSDHPQAKNLYSAIQSVLDFFSGRFNLFGLDNQGTIPPLYLDWKESNARWECNTQDVCSMRFNNQFAQQQEVVAHEYTHGLLKHINQLPETGEAGALNESIADVFAIAFKHFKGLSTDWKIADRDISQYIDLSSLQPVSSTIDHGNVHYNSQIPSFAFYRAVQILGDQSYGKVLDVWFGTLPKIKQHESIKTFAQKTILTAKEIAREEYPYQNPEEHALVKAIRMAWSIVKVIA